jgi:hypothetical protein
VTFRFRSARWTFRFVNYRDDTLAVGVLFLDQAGLAILVITVIAEPT